MNGIDRIRGAAKRDKTIHFTNLMHHITVDFLRDAYRASKTRIGTPQGSIVSPIPANVYLQYVLDLWVNKWRKGKAHGEVIIVRYADDFVMGFQFRKEAECFLQELRDRLRKFGLEVHKEKTRLIEFGRFAVVNRANRGEGKPERFDFLGFTHICGTTPKKKRYTIIRKTIAKRMRAKSKEMSSEIRRRRHDPVPEQGKWLWSVVQGHFNYFGVPGNRGSTDVFRTQILRSWFSALRSRMG